MNSFVYLFGVLALVQFGMFAATGVFACLVMGLVNVSVAAYYYKHGGLNEQ